MTLSLDNTETLAALTKQREAGKRIAFTNGCFDILHVGHIRYLAEANALADILVVGVNSDSSVARLKGPNRPVVLQAERCEMLLALRSVDYVCIFDEDTPLALIKQIAPDVLVKGGDWPVEKIVGADLVLARGGDVRSLPFHPGHSTSEIIRKIETS